jgi:LPS export ABC transporter protein LptC
VAAGLAAFWLQVSVRQAADADGGPARPDVVVEQPFWQLFDEHGAVRHSGRAARLEQWPGEAHARLFEPRVALTDAQQQHWRASARRGRVSADRQDVELERQVRLQRAGPGAHGLVVTGARLRISQPDTVIESDQPVVLASGSWQFNADGLRAEPDRHQLQLLGNVRGRHD